MKYSIIIPCYNETEQDFRRCLNSIVNQTLQPYEVICIDDCSPSCVPQIAKEYNFKYIRHTKNLNNGGARNTGIRNATGDYLVFVNADDYILPETLEEIDKVNKGQDLIIIGMKFFGSENREYIPNKDNTPYTTTFGWNAEPIHVVNRTFILNNNLFEKEHVAYADVDWCTRLEKAMKTYSYVSKILCMLQTGNKNSLSTKILAGEIDPFKEYKNE